MFVEKWIVTPAFVAALVSLPRAAHAQSAPGRDAITRAESPSESDLSLRGALGGFSDPGDAGGVLVSGTALYRMGPVAAGGQFEGGAALFDYGFSGVGLLAGISVRPSVHARIELLGTVGHHAYRGVDRGFMSDDPGVSGESAYAGARAGGSYLFGSRGTHLELGLYGGLDDDLSRETKTSRYTSTSWFGGETSSQESRHTVGTKKYSVVFSVGMTRDVW